MNAAVYTKSSCTSVVNFGHVNICMLQMLPPTTNLRDAYKHGTNEEQNFIQNLSLFLCTFLKEHGVLIEKRKECHETLLEVCVSS